MGGILGIFNQNKKTTIGTITNDSINTILFETDHLAYTNMVILLNSFLDDIQITKRKDKNYLLIK